MAGTAKDFNVQEILQGPGDIWYIPTAPTDIAQRLTLAADGTPDATTHAGCIHLGASFGEIKTVIQTKLNPISVDQFDAPLCDTVDNIGMSIEADMAQISAEKLQRAIGVGVLTTDAAYKQVTVGGIHAAPLMCIAAISKKRSDPTKFIVTMLYAATATTSAEVTMGRTKQASMKVKFEGRTDPTRTAGRRIGIFWETIGA